MPKLMTCRSRTFASFSATQNGFYVNSQQCGMFARMQTGLHHHMKLNVTFGITPSKFSLCVYCDDHNQAGVGITLALDEQGTVSVSLGGTTQRLTRPQVSAPHAAANGPLHSTPTVAMEVFTDGVITELFAGRGEAALSHTVSDIQASGVGYMMGSGSPTASVELQLWGMQQSVF